MCKCWEKYAQILFISSLFGWELGSHLSQNSKASLSVGQSAEVLALKQESRILRQDKCPRILLFCYRARNSGPDITSPKVTLLLQSCALFC